MRPFRTCPRTPISCSRKDWRWPTHLRRVAARRRHHTPHGGLSPPRMDPHLRRNHEEENQLHQSAKTHTQVQMRIIAKLNFALFVLLARIVFPAACQAQGFTIQTDHTNGIYNVGDTVIWQINAIDRFLRAIAWIIPSKRGQLKQIDGGNYSVDKRRVAVLRSTFDLLPEPCSRSEIRWGASPRYPLICAGAVAAPFQNPSHPTNGPADFDSFWQSKINEGLKSVPENVELISKPSGKGQRRLLGNHHGQRSWPYPRSVGASA